MKARKKTTKPASAGTELVDLRRFDDAGCDQWYPNAVVMMTPRLAEKWGPQMEGNYNTRAYDMLWMSIASLGGANMHDGHLFAILVDDAQGRDVEVTMRVHLFGKHSVEGVVFSLPDEDLTDLDAVNVPGRTPPIVFVIGSGRH